MVWLVVILAAANLSTGLSFLYHKQQDKDIITSEAEREYELPAQQRTRFFREQLNLNPRQVDQYRSINRSFNRMAWNIKHQLSDLRAEMVNELKNVNPDEQKLEAVTSHIGALHKQLKDETINYYLEMKNISSTEQQEKLYEIFMLVLEDDDEVKLPQRGRGPGFNRQSDFRQ